MGLSRAQRIRRDRDVEKLIRAGRRFTEANLTLFCLPQEAPNFPEENATASSRLAIRIEHRLGNAVVRNKMKRVLREIFRKESGNIRPVADILLLVQARPQAGSEGKEQGIKERASDLRKNCLSLCRKSGLVLG